MATGLVGDQGSRQAQRTRPDRPRTGPARPGTARPGSAPRPAAAPKPAAPGIAAPGPAALKPAAPRNAAARPASAARARSRTPFVVLLLGLLGGGLVCLLLINTTLAEGSFQITALQQKNAALAQQEQALQQQADQEQSPASIAARAEKLGMRPVGRLRFLDLKNGHIYNQPATEPGIGNVPGYTP